MDRSAPKLPYDQFLLFGDSLTQGSSNQSRGFAFAPALADDYMRKLDVVNRGFSGYNTSQALKILPEIIPSPTITRLRFMMVFFGANDACHAYWPSKQHVPLDLYRQNLESILKYPEVLAQSPRLILVTPPPVDEHQFEADPSATRDPNGRGRSAAHTKLYADACREVGKKLDVAVLDLWSIIMEKAGNKEGAPLPGSLEIEQNGILKELLYDGLHFGPAAYKLLYEEITKLIAKQWPDQSPEQLDPIFPLWGVAPGFVELSD